MRRNGKKTKTEMSNSEKKRKSDSVMNRQQRK